MSYIIYLYVFLYDGWKWRQIERWFVVRSWRCPQARTSAMLEATGGALVDANVLLIDVWWRRQYVTSWQAGARWVSGCGPMTGDSNKDWHLDVAVLCINNASALTCIPCLQYNYVWEHELYLSFTALYIYIYVYIHHVSGKNWKGFKVTGQRSRSKLYEVVQ